MMKRNSHTVIACPVCSKKGHGRGIVQPYWHTDESDMVDTLLHCLICGWYGTHKSVQSYTFPCVIYQVVEIDLSTVENILSMALQKSVPIEIPYGTRACEVLTYSVESGKPEPQKSDSYTLENALLISVQTGWLEPGLYKVEIDV